MRDSTRPVVVLPSAQEDTQPRPWPALMNARTASKYTDEASVRAFRKRVGKVYPKSIRIPGRGEVWRRTDLDACIAVLRGSAATILDAADVL